MSLRPKPYQHVPLKTEEDLDRELQYAFNNIPNSQDDFVFYANSKDYNLTTDQLLALGKDAGYTVSLNKYDSSVVEFS